MRFDLDQSTLGSKILTISGYGFEEGMQVVFPKSANLDCLSHLEGCLNSYLYNVTTVDPDKELMIAQASVPINAVTGYFNIIGDGKISNGQHLQIDQAYLQMQ